jgi:hypothetical protein
MALLAERRFELIVLAEDAGQAGLKLSQLRAEFGSSLSVLVAHIKEIDRAVLAGGNVDMAEEPARERLFDVLMRQLEALAPYKEAIRSIMHSARRSPGLAIALNAMAARSQHWMLEAAGIRASGPRGALEPKEPRSCLHESCPFGWMTRKKGSTGRWLRSIAVSTVPNVGPDFSTIFAPFPACYAVPGDDAVRAVRRPMLPKPARVL